MGMPMEQTVYPEQKFIPENQVMKETVVEVDVKEGKIKIDSDEDIMTSLVVGVVAGAIVMFFLIRKIRNK